jgi:hypothetical protein
MTGRRKLLYFAVVVAVLAAALAVPAAAQTVTTGKAPGWANGICQGLGAGAGGLCRGVGAAADKVGQLLGMKPADIQKQEAQGKSLEAIAKEKGVSKEALVNTILESRTQVLQQAVKDGRITQAQADTMLQRMKAGVEQGVTDPDTGLGAGCGAGGPGAGCGGPGAAGTTTGAGGGCAGGGCGGGGAATGSDTSL